MTEQQQLPTPAEYAVMDVLDRGRVCAAMSVRELSDYARDYAAYLSELCGERVLPAAVAEQMIAAAVGWWQTQKGQR